LLGDPKGSRTSKKAKCVARPELTQDSPPGEQHSLAGLGLQVREPRVPYDGQIRSDFKMQRFESCRLELRVLAISILECRCSNPAASTSQSVSNAYGIGSRYRAAGLLSPSDHERGADAAETRGHDCARRLARFCPDGARDRSGCEGSEATGHGGDRRSDQRYPPHPSRTASLVRLLRQTQVYSNASRSNHSSWCAGGIRRVSFELKVLNG
jgi:hypothetical protein